MKSSELEVKEKKYEYKILWFMVFWGIFISVGAIFGIYYIVTGKVLIKTFISAIVFFLIGGIGAGPAAHRYFSHHSFKATRGLKLFLIFSEQISGLESIISWCRTHRLHHKFVDTDADPANIKRGLFFAGIGWAFITPTPENVTESNRFDMSDLLNDADVAFQHNHYAILYITITMLLPTIIPFYFWNESIYVAFGMNLLRMAFNLIQYSIGTSFIHWDGTKPYDSESSAVDNVLYNILTLGEGFHNYHHAFPFDYRNNELSSLWYVNSLSTFFIDFCGVFGWAYDKKTASPEMIRRRVLRTGDGSHWISKKEALNQTRSDEPPHVT